MGVEAIVVVRCAPGAHRHPRKSAADGPLRELLPKVEPSGLPVRVSGDGTNNLRPHLVTCPANANTAMSYDLFGGGSSEGA